MTALRGDRALAIALPVLWSLLIAAALTSALVLVVGAAPSAVYRLLLEGTWGNAYGIGQVLFKATPLVFTGLAVSVALRAGLFNIGVEGQLTVGAFAAALLGAHLPAAIPALVAVPACLMVAFAGGAVVAAIAGALKAWRGAHEVITTIMLNFVVRAAMVGVGAHVFLRESIHTAPIVDGARLHRASAVLGALRGSALNSSLIVAVATAAALAWLLARTRLGFRVRAVGQSPLAAETAGIAVKRTMLVAMALSGGIAGLTGSNFVLGYKYYYEDGFSGGVGYMGIAVAVLGRTDPLGVVLAALALGTLQQGALAINAVVPKEVVDVLMAVIILAVAASTPLVERLLARARAGRAGA